MVAFVIANDNPMPRKHVIRHPEASYHISVRCNNKDWFAMPLREVWSIFERYLFFLHAGFCMEVQGFVVMSNHFHLLIKAPLQNLPEGMNYLLRETSRRIGEGTNRINHVYGGPYHWTLVRDWRHLHIAYKYLYRNPVEAGVCARVEEYEFSTLQMLLGQAHSLIPICDPLEFVSQSTELLYWMNHGWTEKQRDSLEKAFRRKEFTWPIDRERKKPFDLGPEFSCKTPDEDLGIRTNALRSQK